MLMTITLPGPAGEMEIVAPTVLKARLPDGGVQPLPEDGPGALPAFGAAAAAPCGATVSSSSRRSGMGLPTIRYTSPPFTVSWSSSNATSWPSS